MSDFCRRRDEVAKESERADCSAAPSSRHPARDRLPGRVRPFTPDLDPRISRSTLLMDSPLLPRTSQLSSAAGGNLLDESVESNFADLTFDNSSVASSAGRPPPARSSFLPPPRAPTSKPRFSLFAPGASIAPREPSPPPTPLFVRADASAASSTVATASTSSRANPQASASAAPSHASESAASTPQHSLGTSNEPLTVSQLGGGGGRSNTGVDDGADGADMAMQEEESADATLRRTLYELQGLNRLFDKLLSARQGVNVVHEVSLSIRSRTTVVGR